MNDKGAAMTRYEVLKSLVKKWRDTTQSDFLTGDYRYGIGTAANELEAALALPEDSKTVNAELYELAIALADFRANQFAKVSSDQIMRESKSCKDALRYLSLREASGEPMPYKVIRDGDKVRFD